MRLHLGCGTHVVEGWVNVDYALGARCARIPFFARLNSRLGLFDLPWKPGVVIHDLRKPLPWDDCTAGAVYCSHTLEHLTREEGRRLLRECRRVLKPGGVLRLVVPDLRHIAEEYRSGRLPADEVVERLGVLPGHGTSRLKNRLAPLFQFPHKCMYDEPRLLEILREEKFAAAPAGPFESAISDIKNLEIPERTVDAVIIEGVRLL